jgi:hypothetical protein
MGRVQREPGRRSERSVHLSVRGKFEDGTRINFHLTDHFNETPTGAVFFFTRCHD